MYGAAVMLDYKFLNRFSETNFNLITLLYIYMYKKK